ncbi:hypothetical protein GQ602_001241 [Ophiocordyceps camponoti-floridani]|uniref:Uncharacterized protein n=1 Tax=Ophiocordyceps camponoti-floridani TaxID=2030778 RepID=A0A8H4QDY9_9HYPO|nr:hypothetical protein GQ602_001241 [Ophiocordyceps camponoti-floridani]
MESPDRESRRRSEAELDDVAAVPPARSRPDLQPQTNLTIVGPYHRRLTGYSFRTRARLPQRAARLTASAHGPDPSANPETMSCLALALAARSLCIADLWKLLLAERQSLVASLPSSQLSVQRHYDHLFPARRSSYTDSCQAVDSYSR